MDYFSATKLLVEPSGSRLKARAGTRTRENFLAAIDFRRRQFLEGDVARRTVGSFYSAGKRSSRCATRAEQIRELASKINERVNEL